jgi:hypothetical protein
LHADDHNDAIGTTRGCARVVAHGAAADPGRVRVAADPVPILDRPRAFMSDALTHWPDWHGGIRR